MSEDSRLRIIAVMGKIDEVEQLLEKEDDLKERERIMKILSDMRKILGKLQERILPKNAKTIGE